jgi:uncharacterized membrane protein YphA (DoxX/SURF4 family)
MFGRIVFGASAAAYGAVALMWRHSDMWQHVLALRVPFGTLAAWCLAVAQIAGGIGVLHPRTARLAAVVLGAVYVLFTLACIPGIVGAPAAYERYGAFFEQLCAACGALAVYAVTQRSAARSAALGRAARIGLGLCAISFTLAQIVYLSYTASLVPAWIPPDRMFWAVATTLAFALAAAAILLNRLARVAMRLMTLMLVLFGVLVWVPHVVAQPRALPDWSELLETFLIAGAAWAVSTVRSF